MNALIPHFHSYLLCLLRPKLVLDWLKHGIAPYSDQELPFPDLAPQISISWAFAVVQGLSRLLMANLIMQLFIHFQNSNNFFFSFIDVQDGLFPYYFMLFSTALDLVFFPIIAFVTVEFWNFIFRTYAGFLKVSGDRDEIAKDITNVALSSNFFLLLPIIGIVFKQLAWLYLLYVGCRHQLGASRVLTILILATPTVLMLMAVSLVTLIIFYLFSA
jgi:hypothetical protein